MRAASLSCPHWRPLFTLQSHPTGNFILFSNWVVSITARREKDDQPYATNIDEILPNALRYKLFSITQ